MKIALYFVLAALLSGNAWIAKAEDAATNAAPVSEADKAWQDIQALQQRPPPTEWKTNPPTEEVRAKYALPILLETVDKAKAFYTRFPDDAKVTEAHILEHRVLNSAIEIYSATNLISRQDALDAERLKDPKLTPEEHFYIRADSLQRLAKELPDKLDEFSQGAVAFQREYPNQQAAYSFLGVALQHSEGEKQVALAKEIAAGTNCPESVKKEMADLIEKLQALGKPLDVKFMSVDGRAVDLGSMQGKVVLVDFWATWCGPCKAEIPHVREAYEKLHAKGFEIVGISFDQSKETLEKYTAQQKMEWPQYFDGTGWGNQYGKKYGITSIPTMWLVDKKGNLRDMNARGALEEKVTKLLAE